MTKRRVRYAGPATSFRNGPVSHHRFMIPLAGLWLALAAALPVAAQEPPPLVPHDWEMRRPTEESQLTFCVDTRDDDWQVGEEIGNAIAEALLLEPKVHVVDSDLEAQSLDDLYALMLESCYVHMGFKLLPATYPAWFQLSRAYYQANYVYVTRNEAWKSLSDVPPKKSIASTMGTRADIRLIGYLTALDEQQRWARFPLGTGTLALQMAMDGTADVALVWEPVLWAAQQKDPALSALHVISSDPLPETTEGVGAVVLGGESYLRTSIDEAIAALTADGTIARIIAAHPGFPAKLAE